MEQIENDILNPDENYLNDFMVTSTPMPNPVFEEETYQDAEDTQVSDLAHLAVMGTEKNSWLEILNQSRNSTLDDFFDTLEGSAEETIEMLSATELDTPENDIQITEAADLTPIKRIPHPSPKVTKPSPNQEIVRKSNRVKKKPERFGSGKLFGIFGHDEIP